MSRSSIALLAVVTFALVGLTFPGDVASRSILESIPGFKTLSDTAVLAMDAASDLLDQGVHLLTSGPGTSWVFDDDDSKDPDRNRNVVEIIRSRGFEAESYDVVTKDGYILNIQRIINPLVMPEHRAKMKPIIMQHGLMSSAVDWVINSPHAKPSLWPELVEARHNETDEAYNSIDDNLEETLEHPNSLGYYMANRGYDVFLANSRGNIYGQRHVNMSKYDSKFWAFTFDEQIMYDLPDTIEFVQKLTNKTKVGYVGHSQGTAMILGLLSDRPEYADIVEPVVTLAPVTYVSNAVSPAKYFAVYTPIAQHLNMPFATSNVAVRYLAPLVCKPEMIRKEICSNLLFLTIGFDWDELDLSRMYAYMGHMPSGTSIKNIAHWGQLVLNGRFAHFDHGILVNQMKYGKTVAPEYDLSKIRSKSLAMFIAENDWLADPKDTAKMRAALTVEPYAVFNITEVVPRWNHIDFVYAKHAGEVINTRVEKVFRHFDNN